MTGQLIVFAAISNNEKKITYLSYDKSFFVCLFGFFLR